MNGMVVGSIDLAGAKTSHILAYYGRSSIIISTSKQAKRDALFLKRTKGSKLECQT